MKLLNVIVAFSLCAPALGGAQEPGWSTQTISKSNNLFGVAFTDSTTWIAVGDTGLILRSTDGGTGWGIVPSPVTDALRAVSFHGQTGVAVGLAGRVLRSTDGGASWTSETRPTTRALYSVSMGDSMAVATGEEGTIFVSTDDGVSWNPHLAGTASVLFGVSVHGDVGVGVGGQGAVVMSDNRGSGWGLTVIGTQLTFFYGVSFPSALTGWAVGVYPAGNSLVIRSDLSGFTWAPQTAPSSDILFGVSFVDTTTGTAVGGNGTIIRTTNGGGVWTIQVSGTTQSLNAVAFTNPRLGIAVGNGGTILRTTTGGATGVEASADELPAMFVLEQNYPNPFNPATTIRYRLPLAGHVVLKVFDLLGRETAVLVDEEEHAGFHAVGFDGGNLGSGVYWYRLQSGRFTETRKLVLIR